MQKYIYHGELFADTIAGKDYVFADGKEYSLPEDNTKVKKMQRQKALTPSTSVETLKAKTVKGKN